MRRVWYTTSYGCERLRQKRKQYINNLPDRVKSQIRLFADDSYHYRTISNPVDTVQLQKYLDALTNWGHEWSMEFHLDKCELLRSTNKLKPTKASCYIHSHKPDTSKYLRVLLNKKLSWTPHVDAICKMANQTRAFIKRNLKECQRDVKSQCYKTYVRPIVEYASVVWNPVGEGNQPLRYQIEMGQRRVAWFVTGGWGTTCSETALIKTLQWQTLEQRRRQSRLIFLHTYCYTKLSI